MSQYSALAQVYDSLQDSGLSPRFADYISRLFTKYGQAPSIVLELACGTGELSKLLSLRGFEMISLDISPDMLTIALEKCQSLACPPVFLCQDMRELDLFGTVDAAICCLDSINYITDARALKKVFSKVSLFLNQGGLFIFDVKSTGLFAEMSGIVSTWETEDFFAAWQYGACSKSGVCQHLVDVFVPSDGLYNRFSEEHYQRAYPQAQLQDWLQQAGFKIRAVYRDFSMKKESSDEGRLFFVAQKV